MCQFSPLSTHVQLYRAEAYLRRAVGKATELSIYTHSNLAECFLHILEEPLLGFLHLRTACILALEVRACAHVCTVLRFGVRYGMRVASVHVHDRYIRQSHTCHVVLVWMLTCSHFESIFRTRCLVQIMRMQLQSAVRYR